jgi:hypothetical protein
MAHKRPAASTRTHVKREADALLEKLGYVELDVAAEMNGVTPQTWRNRATAGKTPPRYKLGKKVVHKIVELEAYIARRRVEQAAA